MSNFDPIANKAPFIDASKLKEMLESIVYETNTLPLKVKVSMIKDIAKDILDSVQYFKRLEDIEEIFLKQNRELRYVHSDNCPNSQRCHCGCNFIEIRINEAMKEILELY